MQRKVYLQQGDVACSREPCGFKTVLGSCISVCLWDPALCVGGLNHFVLPRAPDSDAANPRFGDVAIPLLIQELQALGSRTLIAKVFGGARVVPANGSSTVGALNVELALELLQQHRIPLLAQRTGGTTGIALRFDSGTGAVLVRNLSHQAGAARRYGATVCTTDAADLTRSPRWAAAAMADFRAVT